MLCWSKRRRLWVEAIEFMDWKKLHTDIEVFAAAHNLKVEERNTSYAKGQLTTYRMVGNSEIFYEIRHTKPISGYGSKIRIYSRTEQQFSIKSKYNWLGKLSLKIDGQLSDELNTSIEELAKRIGTFSWTTELINSEWPEALQGKRCLKFECKQIELATAELERIRALHIKLLGKSTLQV
ncbi:MAG: hypothetical protein HEP71_26760 [Roseivirga sp.]|nr:hypothetical protein [Roseivirga sp.]